jgi:hypothetical protein
MSECLDVGKYDGGIRVDLILYRRLLIIAAEYTGRMVVFAWI